VKRGRTEAFEEVVSGMTDAAALLVLHELGAFGALLDGPGTAEEIAGVVGADGRRLAPFLDRVTARGLLSKDDGRYGLVPGDEALFDRATGRGKRFGFGPVSEAFGRLARVADILRDDRPLEVAGSGGDVAPEQRERFLRYLHTVSVEAAEEVADLLGPVARIVDIGSGLGTYSAALLARGDGRATLVDRPNAADAVRTFVKEVGLEERVSFFGGDLLEDDWGDGYDLALVGNLVHNLGEEGSRRLFGLVRERLVSGGRVAVKDIAISEDGLEPPAASRFAVSMAMFTERGGVFAAATVGGWLEDAGFTVEAAHTLQEAEGSYLIVAR